MSVNAKPTKEMEKMKMENNGSLNATEIAVGSLLAGRHGYGDGGAWGGGYAGYGPWASPSANAVRLNRNADATSTGFAGVHQSFDSAERSRQVNTLTRDIKDVDKDICDKLGEIQVNQLRENADLSRQLAQCCCDNQLVAKDVLAKVAECCCETQKEVVSDGQKTRDLINANALRVAESANNVNATVSAINGAAAQNTAAIIQAINNLCHHHPHPC